MFLKCLVSMAFITNAEGFCRSSRFKISFNISLARTGSSVVRNAKTSQQTAWFPRTICICEQNRCTAMLAKPHAPWIEVVVFKKYCWIALLSLYLMISCLRCYDVLTSLLMLKIKHFWEQSRIAHRGKQMCISSCAAWLAASLYWAVGAAMLLHQLENTANCYRSLLTVLSQAHKTAGYFLHPLHTVLEATFPYSENLCMPCFHRTPDLGFGMLLW